VREGAGFSSRRLDFPFGRSSPADSSGGFSKQACRTDHEGGATPAERWSVGHRIRDVEVGPDGALWMLEDANPGGLFRVTPR
jgi:glucose/arabinose dehydrogenase